ncbi:MAG: amino acid permease [candidate division Zixibacteria bacterium]|nr:amino acid permease [candidate division Zixibacteria bacterium]
METEQDEGLIRGLGPLEATTIIIGGTIGSGIFRAPSFIAAEVGSPGMSLTVWVVCGLIALCGGLCFAELGAMMPRTGGQYVYLREAYRKPYVAFMYGWSAFWIVWPVSIAAVANVFATYLASVVHTITDMTLDTGAQNLVAVSCIALLTMINCVGVRLGGRVTNWFTYLKVAALGGLILLGLSLTQGSMAHFTPFWGSGAPQNGGGFSIGAFGAAMITGLFAYEGWTFSSYVAGEMRNPHRSLPFSVIAGMFFVMAIYLLANVVYIYVLPFEQVQTSSWIAADVMNALVGPTGALLISIGVMCSTFGGVNVQILVAPRVFFAMARDGLFFQGLTKVHPKYRTPAHSILWQGILACVFALSGQYDQIIAYGSFPSYGFSILAILAVMVLRHTKPDADRPYRVWGYPLTPVIFILVTAGYMVTLLTNPLSFYETLIGLGLTLAGIPFYYYWSGRKKFEV